MEIGKWVVFAFLLGAVVVGFKSRQLKAYEFIVCGAFMILLDGLVFHGAISRWIGELGRSAKNAVSLHHLHGGLHGGLAALGVAAPIGTPGLRRFAAACWRHRPGGTDLITLSICASVLAGVFDLSVPATGAIFAGALVALVGTAAAFDPTVRRPGTGPGRTAADGTAAGAPPGRADGGSATQHAATPTGTPDGRGRRDG